jgi:hypothetical protein
MNIDITRLYETEAVELCERTKVKTHVLHWYTNQTATFNESDDHDVGMTRYIKYQKVALTFTDSS